MEEQYNMVATTMFGLESLLEKELEKTGASQIKKGNRCVYFVGDKEIMYQANIQLRTALKILKILTTFKAKGETELYNYIRRVKWYNILNVSKTFSVTSTTNSKYFTHSNYVSLVTKDAIVDQFRKKVKNRPSVDLKNPDINIYLHISDDKCTISLNSSGESLHKRGYRTEFFPAPINEVLAAGIISLIDWDGNTSLIDPMCGSGTMLIEAALIGINRAPNIYRKSFNFQNWKDYDNTLFKNIKSKLIENEKKFDASIKGFDISESAISTARKHIQNMKLDNVIKIQGQNFFTSTKVKKNATIFLNPPYGKRLELKKDYYKQIGDTLKQNYTDTYTWIISSEMEEIKKIGLRASRKIKLFNGPLECKLLKYELYKGSKKANKSQNE